MSKRDENLFKRDRQPMMTYLNREKLAKLTKKTGLSRSASIEIAVDLFLARKHKTLKPGVYHVS